MAQSLDRLVDRAMNPWRGFLNVGVPPCREQVLEAMPLIMSIWYRLLSTEALDAQASARLNTLLNDRSGPCYVRSAPDALAVALAAISESLAAR